MVSIYILYPRYPPDHLQFSEYFLYFFEQFYEVNFVRGLSMNGQSASWGGRVGTTFVAGRERYTIFGELADSMMGVARSLVCSTIILN